jgi:hypothetical protein
MVGSSPPLRAVGHSELLDCSTEWLSAQSGEGKIEKRGKTREYLAQLIERAVQNPDDRKFIADLSVSFKKHPDMLEKLVKNPKVMMAVLQGGSEFVELLAKYGNSVGRIIDANGAFGIVTKQK